MDDTLQTICRDYLNKLRPIAEKFGLEKFVDDTIKANSRGKCVGTEAECEMLARMCDDERVSRTEVPRILGKSYRQSYEDGDFDFIKKLKHQGIYSKVSALLFKSEHHLT